MTINAVIVNETMNNVPSDSVIIEHKSKGFIDKVVCKGAEPIRIENESGFVRRDIRLNDLISIKPVGNRISNKIKIAQKLSDISSLAATVSYNIDTIDYEGMEEEIIIDRFREIKSFLNILSDQMFNVVSLFDDEATIIND